MQWLVLAATSCQKHGVLGRRRELVHVAADQLGRVDAEQPPAGPVGGDDAQPLGSTRQTASSIDSMRCGQVRAPRRRR
jgi:hypothetical protein